MKENTWPLATEDDREEMDSYAQAPDYWDKYVEV